MIFHRWRKYPRRKPKQEGRYLVRLDTGEFAVLCYIPWKGVWIDEGRAQVFEGYRVFKYTGTLDQDNRIYTDDLCDLANRVVAWRRLR